jgi:hypothetical protein
MQTLLRLAALAAVAACTGDGTDGSSRTTFFLPTGASADNTSPPTIQLDAQGVLHAVYPAYAGGGAYYAECPASCRGPEDMKVVSLPTGSATVLDAMLALDATGHPQVLLATGLGVHYATCSGDCGAQASWSVTQIIEHDGEKDVTGEAFALDPQGHPRFLMHTYIAYLGIGQGPPATEWVQCDADCGSPASWTRGKLADQIWGHNTLRIDRTGRAHVMTVALVDDPGGTIHMAAYATCAADCGTPDAWTTTSLGKVFHLDYEAVTLADRTGLALTSAAQPRAVFLWDDGGQRKLVYAQCTAADCAGANAWTAMVLSASDDLQNGFDLALDAADHPRVAINLGYNIGLARCDGADCTAERATWDLATVEHASDIPPDHIFLWPNCTVGGWLLHDPSLALHADGSAVIAYSARDISAGGVHTTDPDQPACVAGTDMILGRIAFR